MSGSVLLLSYVRHTLSAVSASLQRDFHLKGATKENSRIMHRLMGYTESSRCCIETSTYKSSPATFTKEGLHPWAAAEARAHVIPHHSRSSPEQVRLAQARI